MLHLIASRVPLWSRSCFYRSSPPLFMASRNTTGSLSRGGKKETIVTYLESHGDYEADAGLLEDTNRLLYAQQPDIPRLPVPSLEESIETFLPSALPFCKDEKERDSLLEAARVFPKQASRLQERLLQRKEENSDSSWLQVWWNQIGYLQFRSSNVIHVSYFFNLANDPATPTMIERGAAVLQTVAHFSQDIQDGGSRPADAIPQRKPGAPPITLCSSQYKYLFSSCRIPRSQQDAYRVYQRTQHAVVAVRGHFYRLPIADDRGRLFSRGAIESLLGDILDRPVPPNVPELGWLTGINRDRWAEIYKVFESMPALSQPLEELQSGLCLLCLDVGGSELQGAMDEEEKNRLKALRLWHGNGEHSSNRWFDKSMQLVVNEEGNLGLVGEHSMADGMPAVGLSQALLSEGSCRHNEPLGVVSSDAAGLDAVPIFEAAFQELSASQLQSIDQFVAEAKEELLGNIAKHSLHILTFTDFGKQVIKDAGFSPDGFVQMAMQLAGRRVFGTTVGIYESVQTRRFLHGRTETTRPVSTASKAFCDSMLSCEDTSLEQKQALLQEAVQQHVNYIQKALVGRGVDRHFFGLSMLLDDDEEPPDLFQHPAHALSKRWRMSTSTLPNTAPGFGNVEPDGVGIGYDILADRCIFTITAEEEPGFAIHMKEEIGNALKEMRVFLESPARPQSKL